MVFPSNARRALALPDFRFLNEMPAADGKTWYGLAEGMRGIESVDLISGETTALRGSDTFLSINGFVVSPRKDLILVSVPDKSLRTCGLYSISQPAGLSHLIVEQHACMSWKASSISPDSKNVLLEKDRRIELLDIASGSSRDVGNYEHAAWAPNGKSVAAFDGGKLFLLDPVTFRKTKSLGKAFDERPTWSQDSRHLLVGGPRCGPFYFSLSTLDVETGERQEIKSTHCAAKSRGYWFVSDEVYEAQSRAQSAIQSPQ